MPLKAQNSPYHNMSRYVAYNQSYFVNIHDRDFQFSVALVLQTNPNQFHMVFTWERCSGHPVRILNWPVKEWTLAQIKECWRIFYEEYMSGCRKLARFVEDQYIQKREIFSMSPDQKKIAPHIISVDDDVVSLLWSYLSNPVNDPIGKDWDHFWTTCIDYEQICVCAAIQGIDYFEDPFPFTDDLSTYCQEDDREWYWEIYETHFPTLWEMRIRALAPPKPTAP